MKHPLLNPDSAKHYDAGKKTAIEMLEEQTVVCSVIGWCECNIFKYNHRKALKGESEADEKKIETYSNYLKLLNSMGREAYYMRVKDAYKKYGIQIEYTL